MCIYFLSHIVFVCYSNQITQMPIDRLLVKRNKKKTPRKTEKKKTGGHYLVFVLLRLPSLILHLNGQIFEFLLLLTHGLSTILSLSEIHLYIQICPKSISRHSMTHSPVHNGISLLIKGMCVLIRMGLVSHDQKKNQALCKVNILPVSTRDQVNIF